jgi:murein DD-endopeptidase MepM/ murein hydrolase activator NlpD
MRHTAIAAVLLLSSVAAAEPLVRVEPRTVRAGDPVLVTVTGVDEAPIATANGVDLQFFAARRGFQAVVAIPLSIETDTLTIRVRGVDAPIELKVREHEFPRTDVIVEDELANPPALEREQIATDNQAMLAALTTDGPPQFTRPFVRPRGGVTSVFGEWRTFNDGHSSQHLGMDVFAREGTAVHAINSGTVTFVGETVLGGNVVVVAHGAGIASAYMHLSSISVAKGDVVERGGVLGKSGHTGRTTGPHLHIAVRVPGGFVDPARFFKLALAPAVEAAARR